MALDSGPIAYGVLFFAVSLGLAALWLAVVLLRHATPSRFSTSTWFALIFFLGPVGLLWYVVDGLLLARRGPVAPKP